MQEKHWLCINEYGLCLTARLLNIFVATCGITLSMHTTSSEKLSNKEKTEENERMSAICVYLEHTICSSTSTVFSMMAAIPTLRTRSHFYLSLDQPFSLEHM